MTAPDPQSSNKAESGITGQKAEAAPAQQWKLKEAGADGDEETTKDKLDVSATESGLIGSDAEDLSTTVTAFGGAFQREIVLEPGTVIGGAYRIVELIGKGGMGQVYLAEHLALAKKCALKVLPSNLVTEKAWRRFQSEAKAISGLDHPNLIRVTDLGIHEDSLPYFAMEYVSGSSLAALLQKKGRLDQETTIKMLLQVCEGIECAHKKGIIHRDLKPANIMILAENTGAKTNDPAVKILDFGLAKLSQKENSDVNLTATGEIFGSPVYMSPEQCLGEPTDERTDIYSLGCTAFECLTGQPPFAGNQALAIMTSKLNKPAPSLADTARDGRFSADLELVIGRMIQKDTKDRYQSIASLKADFLSLQQGRPLADSPPKAVMPVKLSPLEEVLAQRTLLAILVVGIGFVIAMYFALGGMLQAAKNPSEMAGPKPAAAPEAKPIMVKGPNGELIPDYVGPEGWLQQIQNAYVEMSGYDGIFQKGESITPQRRIALTKIISDCKVALIAEGESAIPACLEDLSNQTPSKSVSADVIVLNGSKSIKPLLSMLNAKPYLLDKLAATICQLGPEVGDTLCSKVTSGDAKDSAMAARLLAYIARNHSPENNLQLGKQPLMSQSDRLKLLQLIKTEPNENTRKDLVEALSYYKTPTPDSVLLLTNIVNSDPSQKVVQQAIQTLCEMLIDATESGSNIVVDQLCDELKKPGLSDDTKMYIINSLRQKRGRFLPGQVSKIQAANKVNSDRVSEAGRNLLLTFKHPNTR